CLYDRLRRYFEHQTKSPRDVAGELSQEVFFRVFTRSMANFRGEIPFVGYVYMVAHSVLIDYLRRQNTIKRTADKDAVSLEGGGDGDRPESPVDVADHSPNSLPLDAAIDKQHKRLLREALMKLPPQRRKCLIMSYEGYTNQETADALGLSRGAVSSHLTAARKQIKEYMASYSGEPNL
ncbi:MAG TPA: sigma-70 family RNA polymerase sigma factor, partial [Pyrinomonadaceae bacterium]